MKQVIHIRSGQQSTITDEAWEMICKNGFQADFQLVGEHKPPKEVAESVKPPKEKENQNVSK